MLHGRWCTRPLQLLTRRLGGATRDERGYSLVEVMLSMVITVVGVMGTVAMVDGANGRTASTTAREGASNLARQVIEGARAVPYPQLIPGAVGTQIQTQPGLADSQSGGQWTINRRNVVYTIDVDVCSMDDPADGAGGHGSGTFCSDVIAGGTADASPDDYKRIVVELSWRKGGDTDRLKQTALVNNPGNAAGPGVQTLFMSSPTSSPVTSDVAQIDFGLTTSTAPATVGWSVDGVAQSNATGNGTSWSFTWPVSGLLDGSYLVSSQAFDQAGASGSRQALTVTLNRFAPNAPEGLAAGRTTGGVDLEWLPNKERDIVGYRVYRRVGTGPDVLVCPLTEANHCQDTTAPDEDGIKYEVVAVDRDAGGSYREGARSATKTVNLGNTPPNAPTSLSAVTEVDGSVTLTWQAPSPADPDSGDSIDFYRIYRDGTAYADRYDRTGLGTDLQYTDTSTGGGGHSYWVVAVDTQLAESNPTGPVSP